MEIPMKRFACRMLKQSVLPQKVAMLACLSQETGFELVLPMNMQQC
jgi:hypothetical protein